MPIERDKSKVDFTKDGNYKFFPDEPLDKLHADKFASKEPSQFYDPCAEASKMSLNCLERNNYDKSACLTYFQAYRDCKKTWQRARKAAAYGASSSSS
ncbi:Cox23p [Sugiyamaella lignohabitans]|uniref:Cytochrome c oxidase-assembly factor COX23, mitochondrial n=1 Tax=Sugiyamaella lignohabitans TaxID=796027 RepID=A0A167DD45_9ASCO|nr:Cox23p [Sugiyamaella lignohabitans]ANB12781.1 Cox23p [Sugiyamaella lignohabitans]